MFRGIQIKRTLALSTALSVAALGATTTFATATPGNGNGNGQANGHSKVDAPSKDKQSKDKPAQEPKQSKDKPAKDKPAQEPKQSKDKPAKDKPAQEPKESKDKPAQDKPSKESKDKPAQDKPGKDGKTGGNNGTVKIDGWTLAHGTGNGAPNRNEPHVDCTFDVEWYNFDASVTSTVTFAMQAPTADVGLGAYQTTVQLDDDDASGANAAGLDAVQPYELVFDGEPHPKHGYHVKLTVNTPESNGADVKHKVFWVEGCDETETPEGEEETETPEEEVETPEEETETPEGEEEVETPEVEGEEGTDDQGNDLGTEVLGEQASAPGTFGQQGAAGVPSAVDAGQGGSERIASVSTMPLMVTLYGALLAGLALLVRRRRA